MKEVVSEIRTQILILGSIMAVMWGLELLNTYALHNGLNTLGILPRQPIGLRGIIFAPFLHANFAHLSANTVPFLILGWLIMSQSISNFVIVSVICMVVGGFGTWLFGVDGSHIGASGVIFGYIGFLLALYYFDRRISSGIIALFVGCTYGSVLWALVSAPAAPNISWAGHMFGFLSGILAAKFTTKR
jgi:membrane associated rhomboid family serine protease